MPCESAGPNPAKLLWGTSRLGERLRSGIAKPKIYSLLILNCYRGLGCGASRSAISCPNSVPGTIKGQVFRLLDKKRDPLQKKRDNSFRGGALP